MNRVLIAALLVGVGTLALAQAQPESTERPRSLNSGRAGSPAPVEKPRVTVDFKGGTLAEYVAALRATQPAANVVISDAAAGASVPPVQLSQVSVYEAMMFLNDLRDADRGSFFVRETDSVYTVNVELSTARREGDNTVVMSIGYMVNEGMKSEDILSALDAAVQTAGGNAAIKFHPETSLIIIRGNKSAQEIAQQTLQAMSYSSNARKMKSIDDVESQIKWLTTRVDALEQATKPAGN